MDDASSISSGEISDAVAGVSTDDNTTVGSSLSTHSQNDRAAVLATQRAAVLHMGSMALQTSSARRHGPASGQPVSSPAATDRTGVHDQRSAGPVFIRRSNQAVVTDLKTRTLRSGTAVAIDDPARCLATATKQKKDSETNTDNSALMVLAQRSRLAAEYNTTSGVRQRSLTPRRLTSASADSPRSSSLGRTQSDSRPRDPAELQSSRKAVSEAEEFDEVYYSGSVGRDKSRCRNDDYLGDIAHQLSASGG